MLKSDGSEPLLRRVHWYVLESMGFESDPVQFLQETRDLRSQRSLPFLSQREALNRDSTDLVVAAEPAPILSPSLPDELVIRDLRRQASTQCREKRYFVS